MGAAIKVQSIFLLVLPYLGKALAIAGVIFSLAISAVPAVAQTQNSPAKASEAKGLIPDALAPEPAGDEFMPSIVPHIPGETPNMLSPLPGQKKPVTKTKQKKKKAKPEQTMLKDIYVDKNKEISQEIDKAAEKIDVFLAGKKVTDKANNSSIRIENSAYYREGGELETSLHFGVNLRLPNLEKKWALKFTSYDEHEEDRRIDQKQFRTQPKEENYGAALVFFKQLGRVKTTFQPRLQLKNPLDMAYYLTFETDVEMKHYRIDPKVEFFARPQKGVGVFVSLPYTYVLSPTWAMVLAQEVEYEDRQNMFTHNSGISFGQKISKDSSIGYAVAAASNNRMTYHLLQYGFAVSYQQMLFKDALSYSIAPNWDFIKERHFKGVVGMRFNVDFIF